MAAASGPGYPLEIFEELLHEVGHANGGGTNTRHIPTSCPQLESTNTCPQVSYPVDKERQFFPNDGHLPYRSTCVTVQLLPTQCATRYRSARVGESEPGARLSQPRSMMCDSITASGCQTEHPVDRTEMRRP